MYKELKKQLLEKYSDKFIYLMDINSDKRSLPQQTIYNVLEPVIKELVEHANVKPYKEILISIEDFLDYFGINHAELKYNNFYLFLKKKNIISTNKKKKDGYKYKQEKKELNKNENSKKKMNGLLVVDPVDSLTKI